MWIELAIALGGGYLIIKRPQDLPKLSNQLGLLIGSAIRTARNAQQYVQQASSRTDVAAFRDELQSAYKDLKDIRSEVRQTVDIVNPKAIAKNAFKSPAEREQQQQQWDRLTKLASSVHQAVAAEGGGLASSASPMNMTTPQELHQRELAKTERTSDSKAEHGGEQSIDMAGGPQNTPQAQQSRISHIEQLPGSVDHVVDQLEEEFVLRQRHRQQR